MCTCLILGAPAAPDVSLTAVSSSEMILQWPVPFTWPDLNITRYDITTNNSINGQTSWSSQSNSLTVPADPNSPLCTLYRYSVVAHNRLGASGPGTVTGGFPRGKNQYYIMTVLNSMLDKEPECLALTHFFPWLRSQLTSSSYCHTCRKQKIIGLTLEFVKFVSTLCKW